MKAVLFISLIADKIYPYALIFQRIGEVIVYATDDIIISKYVNFASVGLYSNYSMLIQAVQTAAYRFFDAVTASIGNLAVTRDKEHVEKILYRILFLNAWMFSFCSVGLLCLLQPVIRIWIGSEYLLSDTTMLVIVINFYLEGMRATMVTFKRATGLFWQSRYKAIAEGALNLVLSIPLAVHFGVAVTLMGTIISTSCISAIVEPYALFRYYFHKGFYQFMREQLKYAVITIGIAVLTIAACRMVNMDSLLAFVIQMGFCLMVPNLCMGIIFWKDENFIYFRRHIKQFALFKK